MKGCRTINKEEVTGILNNLNIRDKVLALTGLNFGTRISETLTLKFGDVTGQYLYINSLKGSDNTSFVIPDSYKEAVNELKAYYTELGINITSETYLFLSRKGDNQPISRIQASRIIKDACIELGIDGKVNTHSFRKSFVTKIYELTHFNIAETKTYSRHKSLANLDYYINTCQTTELINQLAW